MYSNLGPLHKNTKSASMKSVPKNGGGGGGGKKGYKN